MITVYVFRKQFIVVRSSSVQSVITALYVELKWFMIQPNTRATSGTVRLIYNSLSMNLQII